jgi:hypothetical protein
LKDYNYSIGWLEEALQLANNFNETIKTKIEHHLTLSTAYYQFYSVCEITFFINKFFTHFSFTITNLKVKNLQESFDTIQKILKLGISNFFKF